MDTVIKTLLEHMAFKANQAWNEANETTAKYSCVPIPGVGYIRKQFHGL